MSVPCRLSICIPTLNRGRFIGETMDSIVSQINDAVEVVIVDGGSTDDTEGIVRSYVARHGAIHYVRKDAGTSTPSNEGFDRDCDHAVRLAKGDYCWLMTDDDLLTKTAIAELLDALATQPDMVLASTCVQNVDLSKTLVDRLPDLQRDKFYDVAHWSEFVTEMASSLTFVGRVIIRRSIWQADHPSAYFGSGFVHVGVILRRPLRAIVVLSKPLVILRYGNALWQGRAFDIWMINWPTLIWSAPGLSDAVKASVTPRYPYRNLKKLLWYRALGAYSLKTYQLRVSKEPGTFYRLAALLIALVPARFVNAMFGTYLGTKRFRSVNMQLYDLVLAASSSVVTRRLARRRGVS